MMLGLALGWVLGIGTAVALLQLAAAAIARPDFPDLDDCEDPSDLRWGGTRSPDRRHGKLS